MSKRRMPTPRMLGNQVPNETRRVTTEYVVQFEDASKRELLAEVTHVYSPLQLSEKKSREMYKGTIVKLMYNDGSENTIGGEGAAFFSDLDRKSWLNLTHVRRIANVNFELEGIRLAMKRVNATVLPHICAEALRPVRHQFVEDETFAATMTDWQKLKQQRLALWRHDKGLFWASVIRHKKRQILESADWHLVAGLPLAEHTEPTKEEDEQPEELSLVERVAAAIQDHGGPMTVGAIAAYCLSHGWEPVPGKESMDIREALAIGNDMFLRIDPAKYGDEFLYGLMPGQQKQHATHTMKVGRHRRRRKNERQQPHERDTIREHVHAHATETVTT